MTEKLYYVDAYLRAFSARVLSLVREGERYVAVLDRTAFFPEEGGQYADSGFIDGALVTDVKERGGIIYHYLGAPIRSEGEVECIINFEERYEKMRAHTAEHIVSGLVHSLYGFDNVGFHLGRDYVTFDFNGIMTRQMLDRVETLANKVVAENIPVEAYFPSAEELSALEYRSKLELTENVRIVKIGERDSCACCAPHVARTGEVGLIKLLDFEKHKGGVRIYLQAGEGALLDYRSRYTSVKRISELLSTPQTEVAEGVEKLLCDYECAKQRIKALGLKLAATEAQRLAPTDKNALCYLPELGMDELREFAKLATPRVGGILVSLTGAVGDYKYVITSTSVRLCDLARDINAALLGRGGGRPEMIQGSFAADIEKIKEYFNIK